MSDIGIQSLGTTTGNDFSSTALQNLDKDAFLQLLVAQMKYQSPLAPADSNEFLAQAAQYASVEQLENMAKSQSELRSMQMVSVATDMVGREVTALEPYSGDTFSGRVEGVRFGTEPILLVDGYEIPLTSVVSVTADGATPTAVDTGAEAQTDTPTDSGTDTGTSTATDTQTDTPTDTGTSAETPTDTGADTPTDTGTSTGTTEPETSGESGVGNGGLVLPATGRGVADPSSSGPRVIDLESLTQRRVVTPTTP